MKLVSIPGLNIQSPWSELILTGKKTIETRGYDLPQKLLNQPVAVIETPGDSKEFKARIAGIVIFIGSIEYTNQKTWERDFKKHLVTSSDPKFKFDPQKKKFGWLVGKYCLLPEFIQPPKVRGRIYASSCLIPNLYLRNL